MGPPSTEQPAPPRGLMRLLLAAPVWLYRARLGFLLGHRFLLIVHTGRRTRRLRRTVVEVARYDARTREATVIAGWGTKTQWLHNVEAGLAREIWIGGRRFVPAYRRLALEEAEDVLRSYEEGSHIPGPIVRRVLSGMIGWRYDGSDEARHRAAAQLPMLAFRPLDPSADAPAGA